MDKKVRVLLVGSALAADLHADAYARIKGRGADCRHSGKKHGKSEVLGGQVRLYRLQGIR